MWCSVGHANEGKTEVEVTPGGPHCGCNKMSSSRLAFSRRSVLGGSVEGGEGEKKSVSY